MPRNNHGMLPFKGIEQLCHYGKSVEGRFSRLFNDLPPLYVDPLKLHEIGKAGGAMEDKGEANLTKHIPAGLIFFGQFIDHDITLDASSSLSASNIPENIENVRTPTLDLDCIYGDGPEAHPFLYNGEGKLLLGADYAQSHIDVENKTWLNQKDLPRTPRGTAVIGDPRNDENRVISQMQLGFLKFHNHVIERLPDSVEDKFEEAQRIVRWHYQWIVLNDFLRQLCGDWIVDDILANGRKIYRPECLSKGRAFIPIEFSAAIYRFGHTMIPQKFKVQANGNQHVVFGKDSVLGRGFEPVFDEKAVVDWEALLESGDGNFERAGQLDVKLANALLDLPFLQNQEPALPEHERSLAVRNLLRAQSFLLPSGEQIANKMMHAGATEITEEQIKQVSDAGKKLGFDKGTSLWVYILAEGTTVGQLNKTQNGQAKFTKGEGLGPVGARLVAEVIIGLMEHDQRSFMGRNRNWSPMDSHDKIGSGVTSLYELLTAADS